MIILTRIKEFVKTYQSDIILVIGVILISLLSFAVGYIVAKQQEKEPIKIEFRIQKGDENEVLIFAFAPLRGARQMKNLP